MINRIFSDMPAFKGLTFQPGLNILLADKSPGATDLQTRNGAGKSSLVELVHFLLGANVDKRTIFRLPALSDYTFGLDFDLAGALTKVERSGNNPSRIIVDAIDPLQQPNTLNWDRTQERYIVSNTAWKSILGNRMFGLSTSEGTDESGKFGPTFRSLFSYFARRQQANAFISPMRQSSEQQLGDQQVAISYLLGLDWTIPQHWQQVREREKSLKELKRAAAKGELGDIIGSAATLRTRLAVLEERSRQLREAVSRFQVIPEYRSLEEEASRLTRQLGELADENTIDRQLIADFREALDSESEPSTQDLEDLYKEVGVVLAETAIRRFDEVRKFHKSIIDNRKLYLGGELEAAEHRVANREAQMRDIEARRVEILEILRSHGALDQFVKLQAELSRRDAETESVRRQFAAAEQLESRQTELEIERGQLLLRLRQDYREQEGTLRHAILAFEQVSSALYEEAGNLTIAESPNGPQFEVRIRGEKSKGISNMQIFCFDMMLMQLCSERGIGPSFLIHDSHIFDGVDERQIDTALQIGAANAESHGFQYVVTMNSDAMPANPDLSRYILPVRLTDATETGGLFGLRF